LFASTIVLGKLYPYQAGIQRLSRNYLALIIINIIFGLFNSAIDNAGHVGGLIGGYLMMYALSAPNVRNHSNNQRLKYGLLYLVALIILLAVGYFRTVRMYY
jgi:rhomboid protease GluP